MSPNAVIEWKFSLHSWIFEVHSKNSDRILSALQIFGPILVAGPNVFVMLKTFEVRSKLKSIERHSKCILRLRSCLFCEGRISVLKRWFKTPIQNALHGSTVHASLEKKTISWACTAHCSRLLFELKWTGKAFIWRHLNVVICDFAFMLPPESAFCSNHDRKRTFLGCVHAYFAKAESAFWNADSKRRFKTPFTGVLFMLPSRRRRFREHALRIVRAQVNRKGVYMTSFKRGYMWFCVHASTRISVLL